MSYPLCWRKDSTALIRSTQFFMEYTWGEMIPFHLLELKLCYKKIESSEEEKKQLLLSRLHVVIFYLYLIVSIDCETDGMIKYLFILNIHKSFQQLSRLA